MSKKKHKNEECAEEQVVENATQQTPPAEKTDEGGSQPKEETHEDTAKEVNPSEQLQQQLDEMKDKYLRLSAEFDNYRKRTLREKMDLTKYASEEVLRDLLPVIDDLERALKAVETATEINAVKEGLTLIVGKFTDFLKSKGIKEIEAIGKELDTDHHEAITKIPAPDESMKGKIVDVIQKGYMLNDKVMRFSKVVIGE
jgi:molecular chaperone GrpE